jgi:shikimate dehydrogenase
MWTSGRFSKNFNASQVTHACQRLALDRLHEISEGAATIGAVSTIVFDGFRSIGQNTEWSGVCPSVRLSSPRRASRYGGRGRRL